ncbi:putative transposase Ptta/En/Spm plant [Arabidopsis suecica]|uniref:Putative transposase Ptta/En/Spm plant n=1 Tax=Arabidopsis suecica TaxID=45249 RepID=A0A8T1ZE93_ARASU|nr:putative transposase Ptta/En/Spm plant [Arabidopsis suecica]
MELCNMDKSWVWLPRNSLEYEKGATDFVYGSARRLGDPPNLFCPCLDCRNLCPTTSHSSRSSGDSGAAFFDGDDNTQAKNDNADQSDNADHHEEDSEFMKKLKDAETPLYSSCSKYTKVSAIMGLYQIKVKSGMSENYFDQLLKIVHDMLPGDNVLPTSTDAMKKFLKGTFNLTEEWQKHSVLMQMGCAWRSAKSRLLQKIRLAKTKGEIRDLKPSNIHNESAWFKWVKIRTGKAFKERSEKYKAMRKQQILHTTSRKGMVRLADEMEQIKSVDSEIGSNSNVSLKENAVSQILGKDKSGRIRGMGRGVTATKLAFLQARDAHVQKIEAQHAELVSEVADLRHMVRDLTKEKRDDGANSDTTDEPRCQLLDWYLDADVVVAEGKLCSVEPSYKIGRMPIGPNGSAVLVTSVSDKNASLWRPTTTVNKIGQTVGTKIAWPFDKLIVDSMDSSTRNKGADASDAESESESDFSKEESNGAGVSFNKGGGTTSSKGARTSGSKEVEPTKESSPKSASNSSNNSNLAKKKCFLIDCSGSGKTVAEGRVMSTNPNDTVHCHPLGPNASKVWVDICLIGDARVWRRTSEFQIVADALGYNKILMHRDDCEKTAFITGRGTYCYRVMPFGLKNAGATYQRLVNEIFAEQLGVTMEVYIDDMLVKSLQASDHIQHLKNASTFWILIRGGILRSVGLPRGENVEVSQGHEEARVHRKEMTDGERVEIYHALLVKSIYGKLRKHTTAEVSSLFSVPLQTVQRIWRRVKNNTNGEVVDVSHKRKGNCGRKKMQIDLDRLADSPLHRRKILRSLAASLDVSTGVLFRHLKEELIKRHTNAIKPSLREGNMKARLEFCVSMLDSSTLHDNPKFVDMYNIVHIDEKWFYMTKKTETYYLLAIEEEPQRTCQSKNYIGKVMFLAAMARPRFDTEGNETFSGKIGVFPFVTMQRAQRRSRNREAGTLELKPMTSIKREDIKEF